MVESYARERSSAAVPALETEEILVKAGCFWSDHQQPFTLAKQVNCASILKRSSLSFDATLCSIGVLFVCAGCCLINGKEATQETASASSPGLRRLSEYQRKFASMRGGNIFSGHDRNEILQAVLKARLPIANDLTESELLELRRGATNDLFSDLPTQFENPLTYCGIRESVRRLELGAYVLNLPQRPLPVFGTLPLATLNAAALPRGPGETNDVVVFNDALSVFCAAAASVASQALPERDSDLPLVFDPPIWVSQRLKQKPEILRQVALLVYGFATGGHAYPDKMPASHSQTMFGFLAGEGMRDFVVAHELAHAYLGHTSTSKFTLRLEHSDDGPLDIDFVGMNWRQEIDADDLAVRLLSAVAAATNTAFQVRLSPGAYKFSPLLYHRLSGIIDQAEFIKRNQKLPLQVSLEVQERVTRCLADERSQPLPFSLVDPLYVGTPSHPPSWARFDNASDRCVKMLDEIKEGQALQLRDLQKILVMDACLAVGWDAVKPVVLERLNKAK